MIFFVFLSSGLFLGWSLGANDAANIFGTAVGSKMIRFRQAAIVASIFVIIGAVFQGRGGVETLNALGTVDALAGGFTVSLCAATTVFLMTKRGLPVSTSQAVVGGIMGWTFFNGSQLDVKILSKIVSTWISGPILGALFAAGLYLLMKKFLQKVPIHLIKLDSYIRISLVIVGAFAAFSLGANNIANVMGVFVSAAPNIEVDFGLFAIDGVQLLFLLGGIAIAAGIFTYSEKVMNTIGNGILSLSPEAAIVVVLSQAIVLFMFSSTQLNVLLSSIGLPSLPLVPVSSTQVVIGSVLGIGLVKGTREINTKILYGIAAGWIATPLVAGIFTYIALFFVQNVFQLSISSASTTKAATSNEIGHTASELTTLNFVLPGILLLATSIIIILIFNVLRQQMLRLKTENDLLSQQNQLFQIKRTLSELEINDIQSHNKLLQQKLESKRKEYIDLAFNLTEQRLFLEALNLKLKQLANAENQSELETKLQEMKGLILQKMSFSREKEAFYGEVEQIHKDFKTKLEINYPALSEQEKKLATLIRLNLSTKEIATLLSISPKSVEVARYRLKKKLGLEKEENLIHYINNL